MIPYYEIDNWGNSCLPLHPTSRLWGMRDSPKCPDLSWSACQSRWPSQRLEHDWYKQFIMNLSSLVFILPCVVVTCEKREEVGMKLTKLRVGVYNELVLIPNYLTEKKWHELILRWVLWFWPLKKSRGSSDFLYSRQSNLDNNLHRLGLCSNNWMCIKLGIRCPIQALKCCEYISVLNLH